MSAELIPVPRCPDCERVLSPGRICEACGVVPIDTDCQMAVEHIHGAVLFRRPMASLPSKRFLRSDGNGR